MKSKGEVCVALVIFLFDSLANVRWIKAYKQMAHEKAYSLYTIYAYGSLPR